MLAKQLTKKFGKLVLRGAAVVDGVSSFLVRVH